MNHKHLIIWLLATVLITYHTVKLYGGLIESGDAAASVIAWSFIYTLRIWIIFSLLLVIMFKRFGVISMGLSTVTLVVVQYVELSGALTFADYLTPLSGLTIPAVIIGLFSKPQNTGADCTKQ